MQHQIDALMRDYTGNVPGASLLVLCDGKPLVRRSYGMADLEAGTPATPHTNYRLASVSKQFTAAAVLLLAEDDRLQLDDKARRWLPTLPTTAAHVTIEHLLTHTAGLIDYEDVMDPAHTHQVRDADVLGLLETGDRTYFAPGCGYRYSNSGYALLALIVERASERRYADFLRERIFAPLGMANTVAYEAGISEVTHRAYGYSFENGPSFDYGPAGRTGWHRTDQSTTSAVLGDGGIYSSLDDLANWDAALYDERLLTASSLEKAFAPATATDDPGVRYGYGWRITGETLWHSGETIGFRNVIVRYPRDRTTVVLLTNRDDPEPYATAKSVAEIVRPR